MQIVLLCISFTDFATNLEGHHNTCITSITELWTKTWNLFPCYCWKYLSISYEEDLRSGTNTDTTNFEVHLRKAGPEEKQTLWSRNGEMHGHNYSICREHVVTKAVGSLSGSKLLSTQWLHFFRAVSRAGQDGYPGWRNIHPSRASSCCFSRKFCLGTGFKCIWQGLGGGKSCGNLGVGWGEGGGYPPGNKTSHLISWILARAEFSGISMQKYYLGNFHVLSIFESLALPQGNELWED